MISGNNAYGILILNAAVDNLVQGNFVGVDSAGARPVSNHLSGVRIDSPGNRVGGVVPGAGNLISGNAEDGLCFVGAGASNNVVEGNLMGTDIQGTAPIKNGRGGIGLSGAPANRVGGVEAGAGNIISANGDAGIYLMGSDTAGNTIQGNKIGTDITGMAGLGNRLEGIYVNGGSTNLIGGATPGAGNLISGNLTVGIFLTNSSANVIQGNWIGTKADGLTALGQVLSWHRMPAGCQQ